MSKSHRRGRCPSCGQKGEFRYSGVQHWPERVARAAGVKPTIRLWTCSRCHTTVSEDNLDE